MLRFSTQFTKMHRLLLMMMMMMMWSFTVGTAGQCDPSTQYESDGKCCEKCHPGHKMTSLGTCEEPQCAPCGENEYQDVFTKAAKCNRQPYCDPNKNFEIVDQGSIIKQIDCRCKVGFHCSSKDCLTCVPHTKCEPGTQIQSKGNWTYDTVCQKCPEGTFSTESSLDSGCKKWTACGSEYHIQQNGTAKSDNVCEKNSRLHLAVIFALVPLSLIVLTVVVVVWLCRGAAKGKAKGCVESCIGGEREPLRNQVLIANPTTDHICDEPKEPVLQFSQDEITMTPEENEDEPSQDTTKTEKGNYVMQENGKAEVISRQESQTQTLSY